MTKYIVTAINCGFCKDENNTITVRSEAAMWKYLRAIRNSISSTDLTLGARVTVTTEDGTPFKDITFRRNSKGKIEMPNAIKETCRYAKIKAAKAAKAIEPDLNSEEIHANAPLSEEVTK